MGGSYNSIGNIFYAEYITIERKEIDSDSTEKLTFARENRIPRIVDCIAKSDTLLLAVEYGNNFGKNSYIVYMIKDMEVINEIDVGHYKLVKFLKADSEIILLSFSFSREDYLSHLNKEFINCFEIHITGNSSVAIRNESLGSYDINRIFHFTTFNNELFIAGIANAYVRNQYKDSLVFGIHKHNFETKRFTEVIPIFFNKNEKILSMHSDILNHSIYFLTRIVDSVSNNNDSIHVYTFDAKMNAVSNKCLIDIVNSDTYVKMHEGTLFDKAVILTNEKNKPYTLNLVEFKNLRKAIYSEDVLLNHILSWP